MSSTHTRKNAGFTLIELLVIAPIAILVITGFVAVMINLVGDVLITQQRNTAAYETQDGLDQLEQDIRLSTTILDTTGSLTSPYGSNSGTGPFTASSTLDGSSDGPALILSTYATTANPLSSSRTLVYTNQPTGSCASPYTSNTPLAYTIVYFVKNGSLWRRTIVPTGTTLCNGPAWQKSSCQPGQTCPTLDRQVVSNVSSVNVTYYIESYGPYGVTTKTSLTTGDNPTSARVVINTSKNVAGNAVTSSMPIYASRLSDSSTGGIAGAPGSTNILPDFSTWTTATGMTYNASTNEMVCTATGGYALSPLVRVDSALSGTLWYEGYATTAGPLGPYSGVYTGTYYYAANGTTPAYNTDPSPGPYTANGNAQVMPAPLSAWHPISWTFKLGPAVIYTRVRFNCDYTNYTSDTHYRNATLTIRWT